MRLSYEQRMWVRRQVQSRAHAKFVRCERVERDIDRRAGLLADRGAGYCVECGIDHALHTEGCRTCRIRSYSRQRREAGS